MTTILSEDFDRSVSNGWTGGSFVWSLSGGTVPGDYDINGAEGTHTHPSANVLHYSTVDTGVSNHKVRTTTFLSAADVTGGAASAWALARMTDTSNYYAATLSYGTGESVDLVLQKRVGGTLAGLGTVNVGTFLAAADTPLTVVLSVQGSTVAAKAWDAADPEPAGWMVEVEDTALTTGTLAGLTSRRETGNTNANLQVLFDSFTVAEVGLTAVEQDVFPPRVLLSLTDLNLGDSVQLYRVVAGERTLIRAGADDSVDDPSFLRVDAELPFGTPVSYVAVVNESVEYTAGPTTYVLPGGKVALSDAISGAAAEVVILAWPEKPYERLSSTFRVGGRQVAVLGELGGFSGDIELYTEVTSSRDVLVALLRSATEGVVQIRQPGGYDGIDSYVAVLGYTERRWSADGTDQRRTHVLRVLEVEAWAPALEARGFTLQDIADAYDGLTLQDLANDFPTLLDLAQGDFS